MCVNDFDMRLRTASNHLICHQCRATIVKGEMYMQTMDSNFCSECAGDNKPNAMNWLSVALFVALAMLLSATIYLAWGLA